jgi:hypothetical protein
MLNFLKSIALRLITVFLTLVLFSIIFSTFSFIGNLSHDSIPSKKQEVKENIKSDIENIVSHFQYWKDNNSRAYTGIVKVNSKDVIESRINKKYSNARTWGEFYKEIIDHDKIKINSVYKLFDKIYKSKLLTRHEFADVIVTFVQNIPYNLLTTESCAKAYVNDKYVKEMIDNGTECDGNVYGGIYTPTEFINYFKGDCDTRTIFLYTVLNRYNYDTKILNSDFYGHSIIGVNIPWRGSYKRHLGKRYYTWETTSINWRLGDIPPSTSNMGLWYVAL